MSMTYMPEPQTRYIYKSPFQVFFFFFFFFFFFLILKNKLINAIYYTNISLLFYYIYAINKHLCNYYDLFERIISKGSRHKLGFFVLSNSSREPDNLKRKHRITFRLGSFRRCCMRGWWNCVGVEERRLF
jgi:hypothetical protein